MMTVNEYVSGGSSTLGQRIGTLTLGVWISRLIHARQSFLSLTQKRHDNPKVSTNLLPLELSTSRPSIRPSSLRLLSVWGGDPLVLGGIFTTATLIDITTDTQSPGTRWG